ncbi:hypothetical protein C4565_06795 [Candidatus Parcubacteria bacterium]|nr:MAG: hypothetical protein C4565_06795 [Candidatus Parcubacteria bacterium]
MKSKITKIIFLISAPFNQRDYQRFGFEILIRDGFEVCIWDFTPLLYPKTFMKVQPPDPINYRNMVSIRSKKDAIEVIKKNEDKNVFLISLIPYNHLTICILRTISKFNIPYCVCTPNATLGTPKDMGNKLINKIRSITITKLLDYYLLKISPKYINIKPAVLCLLGGKKSFGKRQEVNDMTRLLWIHTLDYDVYLENNKKSISTNTAVFIDNYLPFHPDYLYSGRKHMNPDDYYPFLNRFFKYFEDKTGLEVIIAAHPRSLYGKSTDYFNGRKVIRGATAELIRDAKCVILHTSTAINYCVLFKKPMIFITTDELKNHLLGRRTEVTAPYFGKATINICGELNVDFKKEFIADDTIYSKYKDDYIKIDGSDELPFWQVVSNNIKSLNI